MSKKNENNSIELERKKVSPDVLERVKLFTEALNLNYHLNYETEEEYVLWQQKILSMPDKISVIEGFPLAYETSLDYQEDDIIEVALFKAAMAHDQERFLSLVDHKDFNPTIKNHVLSYSMQLASGFHDIETVKFLFKNDVDVNNLSMVFYKDGLEISVSPIMAALQGWGKRSSFDQELIDLLFDNGLDLNKEIDGSTVYYHIISSSPEEFSIKMLDRISDLNKMQQECIGYLNENKEEIEEFVPASYLQKAIFSGHFELATAMIEKGAKIEKGDELELLYSAVDKDNVKFVKYLFENEYITTLENIKGTETLLAKALLHKNYETLMLLIKKGINIEAKCDSGIYIENSYTYIENKGKHNIKFLTGPTIFAQLIRQAPEDVVLDILQITNVNVNAKLPGKYSPYTDGKYDKDSYLHITLREKKYDVAKKLIELGANINLPFNGTTPIHVALDNNASEIAKFLIKNGADTSYIARDCGKNALKKVLGSGNMDLVDLIIEHSVNAKQLLTYALVDTIYLQDITNIKFTKKDLCQKLVEAGADVNGAYYNGELPLNTAYNDSVLTEYLISVGADVNVIESFSGLTPLNKAAFSGELGVLKLLIDAGADVNKVDNSGFTPLISAIISNNKLEILQLLLDAGADVNFKAENGGPDVWFCCKNKYECAKIIVASGKVKLDGRSEYEVKEYNQIKAKMQFEQKALADIEMIKAAHTECNEVSIKDSFVSRKTANPMLKYYLHGYKSKFKEQIEGAEGKFFTDLADTVVGHLKIYTQDNWPQTFGIAKTLLVNNISDSEGNALHVPKEIIGEIGEYVFWLDVLDSNSV